MTLENTIYHELSNYENQVIEKIYSDYQWNYDTDKVLVLWKNKSKRLISMFEITNDGLIDLYHPNIYDLKKATLENTRDYEIENEELD